MSFCRLICGGIFLMNTRIENRSLTRRVLNKFEYLPALDRPEAEWVVSFDDHYSVGMMKDLFAASVLRIIVANSEGMSTTLYDEYGRTTHCMGPGGHHDRHLPLDKSLSKFLQEQLTALQAYHQGIPASRRDFREANMELGQVLPLDRDPIMVG
jgi:hypothetical protein